MDEIIEPNTTCLTVCLLILTLAHPIVGINGSRNSIHLPNSILKVITIKVIQAVWIKIKI